MVRTGQRTLSRRALSESTPSTLRPRSSCQHRSCVSVDTPQQSHLSAILQQPVRIACMYMPVVHSCHSRHLRLSASRNRSRGSARPTPPLMLRRQLECQDVTSVESATGKRCGCVGGGLLVEELTSMHEFTISGYIADVAVPTADTRTPSTHLTILGFNPNARLPSGSFGRVHWTEVRSEKYDLSNFRIRQSATFHGQIEGTGFTYYAPEGSDQLQVSYIRMCADSGFLGPDTGGGNHRHGDQASETHLEMAGGGTLPINPTIPMELARCSRRHCVQAQQSHNRISLSGPVTGGPVRTETSRGDRGIIMEMALQGPKGARANTLEVAVRAYGELGEYVMKNVLPGGHVTVYGQTLLVRRRIPHKPGTIPIVVRADSIHVAPSGRAGEHRLQVRLADGQTILLDRSVVSALREYAREYVRVHSNTVAERNLGVAHSTLWYWLHGERNGPAVPSVLIERLGSELLDIQRATRELSREPSHPSWWAARLPR